MSESIRRSDKPQRRMTMTRYASAAEADRHDLEFWRQPGRRRSVARVHHR